MTSPFTIIEEARQEMIELLDARDPSQRFRIYRVRDGALDCVAATATAEHVLPTIIDQQDPESGGTLEPNDRIGVLDAQGRGENPLDEFGNYTRPGRWIVNPFARG